MQHWGEDNKKLRRKGFTNLIEKKHTKGDNKREKEVKTKLVDILK